MKKIVALLLTFMLLFATVSALGESPVRVYTLKGPTGIGMVPMIHENTGAYEFTISGAPDEVVAAVASGNADIAAVPTNLAATLYNKTKGGVQLAAINTLGVLSILEKGDTIKTVQDLKGKTLYATGQGSTPEYVLDAILVAAGIKEDVTVEYKAEHAELATLAAAGTVDLVMLPEPNVTSVLMQNSDFRIALDVTALYGETAPGATMSMGGLIVRKAFAEENPEKVNAFLQAYAQSVAFVNENIPEASAMVEEAGILPKAAVAAKAIPNCHIVFIDGEDMQTMMTPFFQMLFDSNPKSVGGALPAEDFYYMAS